MPEYDKLIEEQEKGRPVYVDKRFIIETKQKVQSLINSLKVLEKKTKKTKQSRKAMKVLEDFVKCNLNSEAISKKYFAVMALLQGYGKNAHKG